MRIMQKYPRTMFLLAAALVGLIGFVDFQSGAGLPLLLFYLIPILHASWFISRRAGVVIALFSAGTWLFSNYILVNETVDDATSPWNLAVRFAIFLLLVYIVVMQMALNKALRKETDLARTDSLTGALNSRAFGEVLNQEIQRTRRNGQPFAVAYLDLDNFKTVNDTLGHTIGDAVLKAVVQALRTSIRSTDTVARLGGDEFALLLPETGETGALAMAHKCHLHLQEIMRQNHWPVSASIGVAIFVTPPSSYDTVIRTADALMYEAKNAGKDRIQSAVIQEGVVQNDHLGVIEATGVKSSEV